MRDRRRSIHFFALEKIGGRKKKEEKKMKKNWTRLIYPLSYRSYMKLEEIWIRSFSNSKLGMFVRRKKNKIYGETLELSFKYRKSSWSTARVSCYPDERVHRLAFLFPPFLWFRILLFRESRRRKRSLFEIFFDRRRSSTAMKMK